MQLKKNKPLSESQKKKCKSDQKCEIEYFNSAFIRSAAPILPVRFKSVFFICFEMQPHIKWYLQHNYRFGSGWCFFFFLSFQFRMCPDTLCARRNIKYIEMFVQRIVRDVIRKAAAHRNRLFIILPAQHNKITIYIKYICLPFYRLL